MGAEARTENRATRIAFVDYLELDKGAAYRGGILVTDEWGKPVEFRCTAPVRPNPIQRTLYGETLMPHIAVELVGAPLLRSLEEKPSIVVIKDRSFLDLRHHTDSPVVRLRRQGTEVEMTSAGDSKGSATAAVDSASGRFQPIIMEAHREFPDDCGASQGVLVGLFSRWDLIEPFDRLSKALEHVHQQKVLEA